MMSSESVSVPEMTHNLAACLEEFQKMAIKQEVKCENLTALVEQLTGDFIKSREEVNDLKKRLKKAEKEACKLKALLAGQEVETSAAGARGGQEGDQNEGNCDNGKDPESIFPEEVWRVIFGYLKEPQDLKSCYQTCTKFRWMLQDARKIFLFLDVLKVLQDHVEGFGLGKWGDRNLSQLPNCRLVCHGWKHSVNKFLQEDCPIFPNVPVDSFFLDCPSALRITFHRRPWDDAALRDLSADVNPMISHSLLYSESADWQVQFNGLMGFLQKFGHHVWFFQTSFTNRPSSWYTSLLTCLQLIPNLKVLHLHNWGHQQTPEIEKVLRQNPFPNIPTMKVVVLVDCQGHILESVLTANPQIERLKIARCFSEPMEYEMKSFRKLEQLKELAFNFNHFSRKEFANVNWNLRKLTLGAYMLNTEWNELFQNLENFAGSLVEMNLELRGPNPKPELRLNLPNLRVLNMRILKCFNSIDFILPLANLECLKLDMTGMSDSTEEYVPIDDIIETIQFHEYTHYLKYSNIWRLFPKLKKVSVRTDRNEKRRRNRRRDDYTQTVSYEWQHCYRNEVDI